MTGLIPNSWAARMERRSEKRRKLLAFLRTEIWTTPAIAGLVMGISDRRSIRSTLDGLVADGLIERDMIARPNGLKLAIIGITLNGQADAAWNLKKDLIERHYEKGRIGLTILEHTLAVQRIRIALARSGWKGWNNPDRASPSEKTVWKHRPDAIIGHPSGSMVAVEVERVIKTRKRYQFIVGEHLSAISEGRYGHIVWTCPDEKLVFALRRIVTGISTAMVSGTPIRLDSGYLSRFSFCTFDELPKLEI